MSKNCIVWTPKSERIVYKARVFDVREIQSQSPEGDESLFYALGANDWVAVVPKVVHGGKECFAMVRQWRHGAQKVSLEFPGGIVDDGESAAQAALRELREETGLVAKNVVPLGSISPNPALMKNTMHFFAASDYENADFGEKELDNDEFLDSVFVPCGEVIEGMGRGENLHALMTCALFFYLRHEKSRSEMFC